MEMRKLLLPQARVVKRLEDSLPLFRAGLEEPRKLCFIVGIDHRLGTLRAEVLRLNWPRLVLKSVD